MDCCHKPGFLRKTKGTQHFYHKAKHDMCSWKDESPEHERLKYMIYKICKSEGWDVQTEYRSELGDWIADVLAGKDDRVIVFEVQLSKITLTDLEERDKKYRKRKIESYWILNKFLNQPEIDYFDEIIKKRSLLSTLDFKKDLDLLLKFEDFFYHLKKIHSIGIDFPFETLYAKDRNNITLKDWVINVISGDYRNELNRRSSLFSQKTDLMERALPLLDNISRFKNKLAKYEFKLDVYSKSNYYYNHKIEFDAASKCILNLNEILQEIVCEENGFSLSSNNNFEFKLISSDQIETIEHLIKKIPPHEKQLEFCISEVQEKILQSSHNAFKENIDFSWKREREENNGLKVKFCFNDILPQLTIESSRPWKYQNPAGCTWDIDERDALEFERRGLGKIIRSLEISKTPFYKTEESVAPIIEKQARDAIESRDKELILASRKLVLKPRYRRMYKKRF